MAAHLHDSVLQTLTLMQKRADDPREVASLARRQERELRDWLAGDGARDAGERSLATELRTVAEAIEDDHRVAIESIRDDDWWPRRRAIETVLRRLTDERAEHWEEQQMGLSLGKWITPHNEQMENRRVLEAEIVLRGSTGPAP